MAENNIWYLPGPFHRYEDDVKALAKKAGLRIIDANVTASRDGAAEKTPKVALKPEWRPADESDGKLSIDEIRAQLTAKGVQFDEKAKKADLQKLLDAQG
ncbi:HeH/LEM domain-containing protein [Pseudomonas sp. JS3066]|uniref:HeH/LEM domain-containing protein n=1 Tax=Pseudomonas sp. JS3066 TaxID=3090665 RepID=UPI002E7C480A|nr:HeH/LEM domain-containing protein [Pseudomonas sp. JS3066]WVK90893.1 HeH/LEM domain-containing protein [Pseudomonas sp. JS3066]